jgi:hypothetical protein
VPAIKDEKHLLLSMAVSPPVPQLQAKPGLLSMTVQLWTKVFVLTFFVYFLLSDPDEPYDPGYGYGILVQ